MDQSLHPMTKREFLKCGLLAMGGCALGVETLNGYAATLGSRIISSMPSEGPGKWSKEAMFYEKAAGGLLCHKCPHGCVLAEGEVGRCRNRVNYSGAMYSIAYGNPCAVHIDPIEKKPFFHFLPSTHAYSIAVAGCNLRCLNCQNWQISQFSPKETDNVDLMPFAVVDECISNGCESIAYTYSEPNTFYEYGYDTAYLARQKGIRNVWKSSGFINEEPLRLLCKRLDAANIDLKGFDEDVYWRLNQATLKPILRTLQVLKEEKVWLEITNLVVPQWTDDLPTIRKMSEWLVNNGLADTPLHFSRFTPLYKLTQLPTTPVSVLEQARDIALAAGIQYVYVGNVPGHTAENTYCHNCSRMIVERKGFAIHSNDIVKGKCRFCGEKIPGVWG